MIPEQHFPLPPDSLQLTKTLTYSDSDYTQPAITCSKLTIETRRQFRRSGVFVVNFEHHRLRSEIYPYARISFRNRITNMLLVPAMHAGCDSVSSFSHIRKITTSQTLKKTKSTNRQIWSTSVISFTLFSPSAVTSIQYACYLYEDNKSGSSVNEFRYRMFTEKNLSGDRLPSTLMR